MTSYHNYTCSQVVGSLLQLGFLMQVDFTCAQFRTIAHTSRTVACNVIPIGNPNSHQCYAEVALDLLNWNQSEGLALLYIALVRIITLSDWCYDV